MKGLFLFFSIIILTVGCFGGPLIKRLYFTNGGKRIWFSSWLETGGWPLVMIPLFIDFTRRRRSTVDGKIFLMKPPLLKAASVIGIILGLADYLYSYGMSKLPVSTSSLIVATHLAFTAVFAFFLVKQKFSAYSINAVVLLTVGAGILALHTNGDLPRGESNKEYWLGCIMTLISAVLTGFLVPLAELAYKKNGQQLSYRLLLEFQLVLCFFATVFCTVGMIVNGDFEAIHIEAKRFELGTVKYYTTIIFTAVIFQCNFLGTIALLFQSSSLFCGILVAVLLPPIEILGAIFFHERFNAEKGISLFLCLWGFVSYYYGEHKLSAYTREFSNAEISSTSQD